VLTVNVSVLVVKVYAVVFVQIRKMTEETVAFVAIYVQEFVLEANACNAPMIFSVRQAVHFVIMAYA
jgi:hypothetical protein